MLPIKKIVNHFITKSAMKKTIWIWHGCSDPWNLWLKVTGSHLCSIPQRSRVLSKIALTPTLSTFHSEGRRLRASGCGGLSTPSGEIQATTSQQGWRESIWWASADTVSTGDLKFYNENCRACQPSSRTWSVVFWHMGKDFQGNEDWFGQKHQMEHSISDFRQT